jgi:aminoglycoside phosphotransferase (APT) family kinase protein
VTLGVFAAAALDTVALASWMEKHLPGFAGPLEAEKFAVGQSNPTYHLRTPHAAYVMRCKPAPQAQLLPSAHAIEREYRVTKALAGSAVPVSRPIALCEDEGVIGRAFYLMDHVAGRCFRDNALPGMSPRERAAIYDEANRIIAALHCIEPGAVGLADYGRSGGFFDRQIARWTRQFRLAETESIEAMNRLIDWLPAHIPAGTDDACCLIHGDFKLDNLIFHPTEPRVLAVLDWELSTLGHPLADLGYHCLMWHIAPGLLHGLAGLDLDSLGIPAETEYLRCYEARTGRCIGSDWNFHIAYNFFRLAGIFQGVMKRALEGTASSGEAVAFGRNARTMAELGWRYAAD